MSLRLLCHPYRLYCTCTIYFKQKRVSVDFYYDPLMQSHSGIEFLHWGTRITQVLHKLFNKTVILNTTLMDGSTVIAILRASQYREWTPYTDGLFRWTWSSSKLFVYLFFWQPSFLSAPNIMPSIHVIFLISLAAFTFNGSLFCDTSVLQHLPCF